MAYSGTVKTWYVYIITNMVSGKKYIGLTNSLAKRWSKHKTANGSAPALHAAIKKHGIENFDFANYASAFGADAAKFIETMLIQEYNTQAPNGYNLTAGGDGTLEPSLELRKKLSESHKGKTQSEETKRKRSESLKKAYAEGRHAGNKKGGWQHSNEANEKKSQRMTGEKNHAHGKKQSSESNEKRRVAQQRRMLEKVKLEGAMQ